MSGAIALIPARGGSRRIPRKNVRPFLGVPAIQRVIGTIQGSGIVDRVLVSTDDEEIARLAAEAGAEVPGFRPAALADDHATTIDVVHHAIEAWLDDRGPTDRLWVVYPTAVLLRAATLLSANDAFGRSAADFLVPVLRFPHPVERRLRVGRDGILVPDEPDALQTRTQDLEPAFHDAGQFYLGRFLAWQRLAPLASGRSMAYEVPHDDAVDIDEPEHWARAERLAHVRGF